MNDKAKQFFMNIWGDKAQAEHAQKVVDSCVMLSKDADLNEDVFRVAGWIHDLGKIKDVSNHSFESMNLLDLFLQEHPEMADYYDQIADCILHHATQTNPETIYGKIFQYADSQCRIEN